MRTGQATGAPTCGRLWSQDYPRLKGSKRSSRRSGLSLNPAVEEEKKNGNHRWTQMNPARRSRNQSIHRRDAKGAEDAEKRPPRSSHDSVLHDSVSQPGQNPDRIMKDRIMGTGCSALREFRRSLRTISTVAVQRPNPSFSLHPSRLCGENSRIKILSEMSDL
jgi:hypothetical protein